MVPVVVMVVVVHGKRTAQIQEVNVSVFYGAHGINIIIIKSLCA